MDTATTPATRSYEVAAQREMIKMAGRVGALTAELRIVRNSLIALHPTSDDQANRELREIVYKIDLALEPKT